MLYLLQQIPPLGLRVVPLNSRGRTVAEQFAHVNRVRMGWLRYHRTGVHPEAPPSQKGSPPIAHLIAHESHHRGQIMLAIKQADMKMPDKVAVDGLWGPWIDLAWEAI